MVTLLAVVIGIQGKGHGCLLTRSKRFGRGGRFRGRFPRVSFRASSPKDRHFGRRRFERCQTILQHLRQGQRCLHAGPGIMADRMDSFGRGERVTPDESCGSGSGVGPAGPDVSASTSGGGEGMPWWRIPDRLRWHLVVAASLAIGLYGAGFWLIEQRRIRNGPWEVQFRPDEAAHRLVVRLGQARLGLGPIEVEIPWPREEPLPGAAWVRFDQARAVPFAVPGGRCVFQDLLFLPGTVALELQGTTIEILPRAVRIDGREVSWHPPRRMAVGKAPGALVETPATP